ncbi:hypothetical protein [Aerococcus sp. L_32]|uniref:hypothetical protein n=1 Tax=Aerococcus sp. L_32 TaxID=3422316 RepID=UPI003D6C684D
MDWNNINENKDTNGLGPIEYDQSKVPQLIRKHADNVRSKSYGQEVREAQARNAEVAGLIASEAENIANDADFLSKDTQNRFKDQIEGTTNSDEVIDARRPFGADSAYQTLGDRLDATEGKLNVTDESLGIAGSKRDTDIRLLFQYWYDNDVNTIKDIIDMNINTVIISRRKSASTVTRSWEETLEILNIHEKYGINVILNADPEEIVAGNVENRTWLENLINHKSVIGVYSFDEPTRVGTTVAKQQNFANYVRSITNKLIFQSNVAGAQSSEFYYPQGFDVLLVSYYILNPNTSTPRTDYDAIEVLIKNRLKDFISNSGTPKKIIPILPLFTDSANGLKTKEEYYAHVRGWVPSFSGSYGLFAYHNPALLKDIKTEELYRSLAKDTPLLLSSNRTALVAPFTQGVEIGNVSSGSSVFKKFEVLTVHVSISNLMPGEVRDIDVTSSTVTAESFLMISRKNSDIKTNYKGLIMQAFSYTAGVFTLRLYNAGTTQIHVPASNGFKILVFN